MSLFTPAERLEPVLTWIDAHQDAAIATLQRFCRQPSISAQNKGMRDMAELVAERLRELGAETSLVPTQGFTVVVGQLAGHLRSLRCPTTRTPGSLERATFRGDTSGWSSLCSRGGRQ